MTARKTPKPTVAYPPEAPCGPCTEPRPPSWPDVQGNRRPPSLSLGEQATAGDGPKTPEARVGGEPSRASGHHALALAMSENELERGMRRILADLPQVLAYHTHDSRRSGAGFPDWCLVGPGGVMFRELKRQRQQPTPAQDEWLCTLTEAGADAEVWRPSQLLDGTIGHELAAIAGLVSAP